MGSSRILALCALMAAAVWMSRLTVSSVAPAIKSGLGLTYAELGLPPMAALAFAAVGYGLSGFLTYRFGSRKVLIASALAMLASALGMANSRSLIEIVFFQGAAGLAEGLFYVDALVILTNTFEPSRIGRAVGVVEGSLNVGSLAALIIGAALATSLGWRAAYYFLTVLAILALLSILALYREPVGAPMQTDLRKILADPYMVSLFAPVTLMFLSFWSFWAFAPTYLTEELGFTLTISGAISSAAFLLSIFAALVGGLLADRVGPKRASVAMTVIYTLFLVLFAVTRNPYAAVLFLLMIAFAQAFLMPVVLSFVPKRFLQTELGRAYGVLLAVAYAAGAIGPVMVGLVTYSYGFTSAFLILAACTGLMGILILSKTGNLVKLDGQATYSPSL